MPGRDPADDIRNLLSFDDFEHHSVTSRIRGRQGAEKLALTDYYRHSLLAPKSLWDGPMREGFLDAAARHLGRQAGDRFVRKWLEVRGNALRRERIVDPNVTPSLLQRLDVAICPVLRLPLTHGYKSDSDWSVDRLNNDGAYAPGNLAIISTLANRAKAHHCFADVYERGQAAKGSGGLAPYEWMRIASLMVGPCFAEAPGAAPIVPMLAPLPISTVRSATQIIQYALTIGTRSAADKNELTKQLTRLYCDSHARAHICQVAELIHLALKTTAVIWDVWDSPRVMQAFLSMRASLPSHVWAAMGETAAHLAGGRPVARSTLGAWHLRTAGYFAESWRR